MDFLYSGHHFDFAGIEIVRNADAAENGLARPGRAVDFKAEVDQLIDYLLDLVFTGRILHCYDHECARFDTARGCGGNLRNLAIPQAKARIPCGSGWNGLKPSPSRNCCCSLF